MTNILVTGGAGYVGSHACKALRRNGYTPVTYDNLEGGHASAVRWGPLVRGDLLDPRALRAAFNEYRPRAVMHFAGLWYVGESVFEPANYYRSNVVGSLTLLDVMREYECGELVYSSSCATYGIPEQMPIRESASQQPVNPYGASKLFVERVLQDYGVAYGLRSVALRYFNAAGADPDGEIGESHHPETHLIPRVLAVAAGTEEAIAVYGNDYPTPDGTCIRDYVHVADLAEAHVRSLDLLRKRGTTMLNLGTGAGASVLEVIRIAEKVTGRNIPVVYHPRRQGDPPCLIAAPEAAWTTLGWRPRLSELHTIIEHAWNWLCNPGATAAN